jgi:hypothetical protein
MNKIKSIFAVLAVALVSVACGKEEPVVTYLEVTPNNISGEWKLVKWSGEALDADTYFYIDLVRKDRKYTIYQNFDSMGDMPHKITGEFNIELSDFGDPIIRGSYDYSEGFWSHRYMVTKLTETSMVWTAVDDESFVQKFERCTIPAELK